MKPENLKLYRCPSCRSDQLLLKIERQKEDGWVEVGSVECQKCLAIYRVDHGLPRFVPTVNYADSFGFQWNIHAKTQLDSYSGLPISKERIFGVTR